MIGSKKKVNETLADRVNNAVLGVESAKSVFSDLLKELDNSISGLIDIVENCEKVIEEHKEIKISAEKSVQEFVLLQRNIEKLVGGTK